MLSVILVQFEKEWRQWKQPHLQFREKIFFLGMETEACSCSFKASEIKKIRCKTPALYSADSVYTVPMYDIGTAHRTTVRIQIASRVRVL